MHFRALNRAVPSAVAAILVATALSPSRAPAQSLPGPYADAEAERLVQTALRNWAEITRDGSAVVEVQARARVGLLIPNQWNWRERTLFHRELVEGFQVSGDSLIEGRVFDRTRGAPLIGDALLDHKPLWNYFGFNPETDDPPLLGLVGLSLDDRTTGAILESSPSRVSLLDSAFVDPLSSEGPGLYRYTSGEPLTVSVPAPATLLAVQFETRDPDAQPIVGVIWFRAEDGVPVRTLMRPLGRWPVSAGLRGFARKVPLVQKNASGEMDFMVIDYEAVPAGRPLRLQGIGYMYWFWDQGVMPLELDWRLNWDRTSLADMEQKAPGKLAAGTNSHLNHRELVPYLRALEQAAGRPPYPTARRTLTGTLSSVRFNQVQGFNFRARYALPLDPTTFLDGQLDIPTSGYPIGGSLGLRRDRTPDAYGLETYSRLQDANWMEPANSVTGSLTAVFSGYDDGNYYRAAGGRVWASTVERPWLGEAEFFIEQQTAAPKTVDWSVFATDTTQPPPPDIDVAEGTYFGVRAKVNYQLGDDAQVGVLLLRVYGQAAMGEQTYSSIGTTTDLVGPLPGPFTGALRINMAVSGGKVPGQALYYLGGTKTIRGYPAAFRSGESMFITTAEIGTSIPLVRLVAFADMGYAGPARGIFDEEALFALGGGLSIGDGIVRFDLAKGMTEGGVWRLHVATSGLF